MSWSPTQKEFLARVKKNHGSDIIPLEAYQGALTPIKFKCFNGHTWLTTPSTIYRSGCKECYHQNLKIRGSDRLDKLDKELTTVLPASYSSAKKVISQVYKKGDREWVLITQLKTQRKVLRFWLDFWKSNPDMIFRQRLDHFLKETEQGYCSTCGKGTNYNKGHNFYHEYCSYKCMSNNENVRNKTRKTNIERYGISCVAVLRYKHKIYKLGSRTVKVQGYEPQALNWLISKGMHPNKIFVFTQHEEAPTVPYKFKKKQYNYFPDIYIPHKNYIIEVKSLATVGYCNNKEKKSPDEFFEKLKAKRHACIKSGYNFSLMLMQADGTRLKLPKQWYNMERYKFVRLVSLLNPGIRSYV